MVKKLILKQFVETIAKKLYKYNTRILKEPNKFSIIYLKKLVEPPYIFD